MSGEMIYLMRHRTREENPPTPSTPTLPPPQFVTALGQMEGILRRLAYRRAPLAPHMREEKMEMVQFEQIEDVVG